jgi:hypothetical protein
LLPVEVTQASGDGSMKLLATPGEEGAVSFELEAENWRAPIGPGVIWSNVSAVGWVLPNASGGGQLHGVEQHRGGARRAGGGSRRELVNCRDC